MTIAELMPRSGLSEKVTFLNQALHTLLQSLIISPGVAESSGCSPDVIRVIEDAFIQGRTTRRRC